MSLDDWRLLLWVNALGEEYEEFAEEIYSKWKRMRYRHLAISESTMSILSTLRHDYQLGLITNGPSQSQWEKIGELKLSQYFDVIVVSGDIGCEKPEKKFFQTVFSSMGVTSNECLMVGDRLDTDILGGLKAEVGQTVWLPGDEASKNSQGTGLNPQPDFIIGEISDLLGLLLGRSKKNERKPCKALRGSKTSGSPPSQSTMMGQSTSRLDPSSVDDENSI